MPNNQDNQEIDPDLTMLQPNEAEQPGTSEHLEEELQGAQPKLPDAEGQIVDDVFDMENGIDSSERFESEAQVDEFNRNVGADAVSAMSVQEGSRDMDLDMGMSQFEGQNEARARNQNEAIKGIKAIGGGILQGGLIAMEQAGYVADYRTYTNLFTETQDRSNSWWTDLMKGAQESVRESDAFKIYEAPVDANNFTGQLFKWSSLEGAVSSAVGFGVSGLGAARLVSSLGALGKFKQIASFADAALGQGVTKAIMGPLATSAISNFFMGEMMAADTYNQTMEKLADSGLSDIEKQTIAGNEAQDVVALNMALVATGYIKFGSIFKRPGKIKGIVANPTATWQAKQFIKAGSPTAFTENVYQEMIQMEQIHDGQVAAGMESEYSSEDYWDRWAQLATSDRALQAGALGVVGGPIQFALIQRPMMGKQIAEQKDVFNNQQSSLNWHKTLVKNNFEVSRDFTKMEEEAIASGNMEDADLISSSDITNEIVKTITWGTKDSLRKDMEDIKNLTPEEAAKPTEQHPEGLGSDYKQVADSVIKKLDSAERHLAQHNKLPNRDEVIYNRMLTEEVLGSALGMERSRLNLEKDISKQASDFVNAPVEYTGTTWKINRDPSRFEGKSKEEAGQMKIKEFREESLFKNFLASSNEVKEYNKLEAPIKKREEMLTKLNSKYEYLVSEKGQAEFAKRQKANAEKADAAARAKDASDKQEAESQKAEEEVKGWQQYNDVLNDPTVAATAEVNQALNNRITDSIKATPYKIQNKPDTFTSIDPNNKARNFSPGDVVRSNDGRFFEVKFQNRSGDGKTYRPTMPVLQEVTPVGEKGNKFKATKQDKFVLQEMDFLLDESLQLVKTAKSSFYGSNWGTYNVDFTILKPNDKPFTVGRIEKAAEGLVQSINVPAKDMTSEDLAWYDDYAHEDLNKPFVNGYDVRFELTKGTDGETYVDVIRASDSKKLTRVNRSYNVNYSAMVEMLLENKGAMEGKVTDHFSRHTNINNTYNSDGSKAFTTLSQDMGLSLDHLINGEIILAQTKGDTKGDYLDVARGSEGTLYDKGYIEVANPDGTISTLDIPYGSMSAGDTYLLLRSPKGVIIPMALSSDSISGIESKEGLESYTHDVVTKWQDAIKNIFTQELMYESDTDAQERELIRSQPGFNESDMDTKLRSSKRRRIKDKNTTPKKGGASPMWKGLQDTVFKDIRPQTNQYAVIGKTEKDANIYAKSGRDKVVRDDYFLPSIDIAKTTLSYSPSITIKKQENNNRGTLTETIIYDDSPGRFIEVLGKRRKRTSIYDLANTDLSPTEAKAMMSDKINSDGLKVDFDPSRPFLGASATIEVNGQDFKTEGVETTAAKGLSYYIKKKKFKTTYKDTVANLASKEGEILLDGFNTRITDFVEQNEGGLDLSIIALAETEGEVTSLFKEFIGGLGLSDIRKAVKMFDQVVLETLPQDDTPQLVDIKSKLELQNIRGEQVETIAKSILAINKIQEAVESGELQLSASMHRTSKTDPDGRFTQQEGFEFPRGSWVIHDTYGKAKVVRKNKKGTYRLKITSSQKEVTVYPNEVYNNNGLFAKLIDLEKKLLSNDKREEGPAKDETATILSTKILKVKEQINYKYNKETDTTNDPDSSEAPAEIKVLSADENKVKLVQTFRGSDRADQLGRGITGIAETFESISEFKSNTPVNAVLVETINSALLEAIPYDDSSLEILEETYSDLLAASDSVENKKNFYNVQALRTVLKAMNSRSDFSQPASIGRKLFLSKKNKVVDRTVLLPAMKVAGGKGLSEMFDLGQTIRTLSTLVIDVADAEVQVSNDILTNQEQGTTDIEAAPAEVKDLSKPQEVKPNKPKEKTDMSALEFADTLPVDLASGFLADLAILEGEGIPTTGLINKYKKKAQETVQESKVDPSVQANISLLDEFNPSPELINLLRTTEAINNLDSLLDDVALQLEGTPQEIMEKFYLDNKDAKPLGGKPMFKSTGEVNNSQEEFNLEVEDAKSMLPQVPLKVVQNVAQIARTYGQEALGVYDKGVRYIVENAEAGTAYHETFHAVAGLYLTDNQKQEIAKERGDSSWNATLEEELAREFEVYAKEYRLNQPTSFLGKIGQKVREFFKGLVDYVKGVRSSDVTAKVFRKTVTGGFAKMPQSYNLTAITSNFGSIAEFKESLSLENSLLLQDLIDTNNIEIVC